jgi:DNA-binding NtrC family response regulator
MSSKQHLHILVVEDESIIALDLEDLLERAGYRVTWCPTIREALRTVHDERFNAALLDVAGEHVSAVADALLAAKVPFAMCSGHSNDMMPERHRHAPFLTKPYSHRGVLDAVRGMCLMRAA